MLKVFAQAVLCLAAIPMVHAQAVYRCGNTYSDEPCAGGVKVEAKAEQRTPAEAARASSQAARDWKTAEAMEKSRLAQEARAPKAIVITHTPNVDARAKEQDIGRIHPPLKPHQFVAVEPRKPGDAKKKKSKG